MALASRVDATIDAALGSRIVGCVVLIHVKGEQVYARAAGYADREEKKPTAIDTIFRLASCTKPIVAAAVLAMADRGLLSLDDPVTKYLPYFTPRTADGRTPAILLRHLITHTSGITYDNPPRGVSHGADVAVLCPLDENLRRLAAATLEFVPGTKWKYGMGIDVLGGVIATINGSPSDLEAALTKYVTGPLGMSDTHFYVTDRSRLAAAYGDRTPAEPIRMTETTPVYNDEKNPTKAEFFSPQRIFEPTAPQSGGGGMAGTAGDFMRFLDAAAFGDLLQPATRSAALTNQIGAVLREEDPGQKFGFLGAVVEDTTASGWPVRGMLQWGGIWGNNWIIEPESGTTLVVFTNVMREGCNGPFRDQMRDAVFA
jgi:CubicO group peptidase (beta-lactamase class C family)